MVSHSEFVAKPASAPPESQVAYRGDGQAIDSGLLDHPMVVAYLHTMTTGILVGGDKSKMSVLEKLARLALEN